jgi:hypothetical protein
MAFVDRTLKKKGPTKLDKVAPYFKNFVVYMAFAAVAVHIYFSFQMYQEMERLKTSLESVKSSIK